MVVRCPEEILPEMTGILLISHGPLAHSLVESSRLIAGDAPNVASLSLEDGDDANAFRELLVETYRKFPKGALILVDMKGGTPLNQLLFAMQQEAMDLLALCGANLSMLVEAIFARNVAEGTELLRQVEEAGREAVVNVTEMVKSLRSRG